ncbi:MAG: glycosyltransferase [Microcystis panniformis Mp_MB_F_20051200_S9]|jgi:dolichol-phosphate mannosyltransferase|uniref:Glycosyltransferase n=1 Tax=Microcystis panniformis Mp_MB_F_20051200_S9 TaxID=2486223 RepID=A0A552PI40_9CHRO|nr:MAG: glycosyltransferase [Microcystis panniformis Mp_MB_F_20080800_S26D]TRV49148.1 MAG: glycosyltransferase [Microcystis panniformis Mp_GB_SS_20050300_S99D]TRV53411.1 MAG: glycosyltransferase [Microcystis panniformis Mp_GB_SS_20050300_S99]TRV55280.1 MAG: glycosyltransferase [Microcystis panniformis Mp_MB_F_20080800_S26]TRV56667.1 MAG: glycosyltransferase [Microcystis panniformis Mp_MB_F_20051200_S9]TRV63695.1 MAG: glycosyltransferase [Microcystis panniformis Mp_MB_F_20051200_S9D]TRV74441.1
MPKYSLIIPIYNEEETIPELYRRVSDVMDSLDDSVELILINDGSRDRSLKLMRELQERDARVCYISFARNFGHQAAVTAGLNFARGQVIVVLDADLQDPPELIPKMIESWQAGYHVVYAQRTKRKKESWFKRLTAYVFYRLLRQLADVDIPADTGDFCLMDRQVVDVLNSMPERNRYIRGLRAWIGFRQTAVKFERDPRFAGEVKYTFKKSLALAINSLVSFSKIPLRISTYLGLFSALIALLMALLVLYWRLQQPDSPVTGLATILIAVFFLGSVQLISIGILGEYVGRIYEEVKGRPAYTIAEIAGLEIN